MEDLLFLSHRIPYPPVKGDKIRSYHLLKHFSERYRVYLGTFVDDPEDWKYEADLRRLCAEACIVPLHPILGRIRGLRALLTGEPISLPYFGNRRLRHWVRSRLSGPGVRRVFVYSSQMAQYVLDELPRPGLRTVIDFVDVDSDKWLQYAASRRWPASAIYAREGRTLRRFEARAAAAFDASVFVSEAEAELFRSVAPECSARVTFVENGVDSDYFSPDRDYPDPYGGNRSVFVFTGAMDYWANADAVRWFVAEVFPGILGLEPSARFFIVGSRPSAEVRRLADPEGRVVVTGRVDDVRPYLSRARAAVAPLRIARGVQNKVLEAMAMAIPVIGSPQAMEGLAFDSPYPLVAEEPREWIERVGELLSGVVAPGIGPRLRRWVLGRYGWSASAARCVELLEEMAPTPSP